MSELVQTSLPFPKPDTPSNTREISSETQSQILALAEKLDYVNPLVIDDLHIESEHRLVAIRRSWLEYANGCVAAGDFSQAVAYMKYVIEDIEHSADQTYLDDAKQVLELCRNGHVLASTATALARATRFDQAS